MADRIEHRTRPDRASIWKVGLTLHRLAGGHRCAFASSDGYPQVQLASGCEGRQLRGSPVAAATALERVTGLGEPVFVVERSQARLPAGWVPADRIARLDGSSWVVVEVRVPGRST